MTKNSSALVLGHTVTLVACVFVFSPSLVLAAPVLRYVVDARRSQLVAHLLKGGVGSGFAHDHVVRARRFSGELELRDDDLSTASIRIVVDARSLEPDDPALRRAYGMKTMLDASVRAKVRANLHGKDQLHTARYGKIRFASTSVTKARSAGHYRIGGTLTIRGKTQKVSLVAKLWRDGRLVKGSGRLAFRQSHFGYAPYSAGLGFVKVKDRATLNLYLEARPAAK